MAKLRNKNGCDYTIIASRPSNFYKGHKDYLVQDGRSVTVARGWKPECKEWEHSTHFGFLLTAEKETPYDKQFMKDARTYFKNRRDEK